MLAATKLVTQHMDAIWQAVFFGAACVIFVVLFVLSVSNNRNAEGNRTTNRARAWAWQYLAWALFVFVFFLNAVLSA